MHRKHTCGTVGPGWIEEQVFQAALREKYTNFDQFSWSSEPHNCEIRPTDTLKVLSNVLKLRRDVFCYYTTKYSLKQAMSLLLQLSVPTTKSVHSALHCVALQLILLRVVSKREKTLDTDCGVLRHDLTDSPCWPVTCYCRPGCPRT